MLTKKCRLFQVFHCLLPSFSSILVVSVTNIYFGLLFLFSFGRLAELLPSFLYFHMLITWFPFFEYFLLCVCFKMKLFFVWEFSEIESEPTASFVPTILNPFSKIKNKKGHSQYTKLPLLRGSGEVIVRQHFQCLSFFFTYAPVFNYHMYFCQT